MGDVDDQWEKELNHLESVLKDCLEARANPRLCVNERLTLMRSFRTFDTNNSGDICYPEFVRSLERFGLVASPAVRGLYDRYAMIDGIGTSLTYSEFCDGLYGDNKPPPQPRKDRSDWELPSMERMRESPTNKWQNSSDQLSPSKRPVRVVSIANPKHREMPPVKWSKDANGDWESQGQ